MSGRKSRMLRNAIKGQTSLSVGQRRKYYRSLKREYRGMPWTKKTNLAQTLARPAEVEAA